MESENLIFLSLFFSVLFALWGSTSFAPKKQFNDVPSRFEGLPEPKGQLSNFSFFISSVLVFVANFVLTVFLLKRWIDSGYPPFSNLYESLLFLTWALLLFYFPAVGFGLPPKLSTFFGERTQPANLFEESLRNGSSFESVPGDTVGFTTPKFTISGATEGLPPGAAPVSKAFFSDTLSQSLQNSNGTLSSSPSPSESFPNVSTKVSALIGMLLVSASLFIYTFATWLLPSEMKEIKPLVPALKSNWLLMHVSIMLLSYSALLAGSLLSILYLAIFYSGRKNGPQDKSKIGTQALVGFKGFEGNEGLWGMKEGAPRGEAPPSFPSTLLTDILIPSNGINEGPRTRLLTDVDSLSYRSLAFAFPLLTLGIISGAVWANEAWGSYWSWDPKETWALITWFIFSIYLHLRIQKAWEGEKAAWVGCIGFFVVWICYLGVNLLGKGLHSYGWWN